MVCLPSLYVLYPRQVGTDTWSKVFAGWKISFELNPMVPCGHGGLNDVGQLGIGNSTNQFTPVQVGTDTDWVDVVSEVLVMSNLLLLQNQMAMVWAWEINQVGQYVMVLLETSLCSHPNDGTLCYLALMNLNKKMFLLMYPNLLKMW